LKDKFIGVQLKRKFIQVYFLSPLNFESFRRCCVSQFAGTLINIDKLQTLFNSSHSFSLGKESQDGLDDGSKGSSYVAVGDSSYDRPTKRA
jgi:hypothetical protein